MRFQGIWITLLTTVPFVVFVAGCIRPPRNEAALKSTDIAAEPSALELRSFIGDINELAAALQANNGQLDFMPSSPSEGVVFAKAASGGARPGPKPNAKPAGKPGHVNSVNKPKEGTDEEISWPPNPTMIETRTIESENEFSLHMGFEASLAEVVAVTSKASLSLSGNTSKYIMLIKHSPNNNDTMLEPIEIDVPGKGKVQTYKPYTADGYDYVGQCVYSVGAGTTFRSIQSIKIAGNGFSTNAEIYKDTQVMRYSKFFRVTSDDTIASLTSFCLDSYTAEVASMVKDDLANFIIAEGIKNTNNETAEKVIIDASLFGPQAKRAKYNGHHWNIDKATVESDGKGTVTVNGRAQHDTQGMLPDDINYSCTVTQGKVDKNVTFKQRSTISHYRDDARSWVEKVCADAFVEFRDQIGKF